MSKAMGLLID